MNSKRALGHDDLFRALARRMEAAPPRALNSEAWRREFLISPVLTSDVGLRLDPSQIACEISFPITPEIALAAELHPGRFRVRPDYLLIPESASNAVAVIEAKVALATAAVSSAYLQQVLLEQLVSRSRFAALTNGPVWVVYEEGELVFSSNGFDELAAGIRHLRELLGAESLLKERERLTPVRIFMVSEPPSSRASPHKPYIEFFPGLRRDPYVRVLAPATPTYNSFAWAAGDDRRWWFPPIASGPTYWPVGAAALETVEALLPPMRRWGTLRIPILTDRVSLGLNRSPSLLGLEFRLMLRAASTKIGGQASSAH
ncbi:MAG TPA: hypothetical protein VE596_14430 [Gaiellaceae bacterium]|nr:hypothetical protein [Gaiellaceae bacterium]